MQEELEEELQEEEVETEEEDETEDIIALVPPSEAKRLQAMQEEFIAKNKKVQTAEYAFKYEKKDDE